MKYIVHSDMARKLGAIGIFYPITEEIEAANEEEARKIFYDTHELYLGRMTIKEKTDD